MQEELILNELDPEPGINALCLAPKRGLGKSRHFQCDVTKGDLGSIGRHSAGHQDEQDRGTRRAKISG